MADITDRVLLIFAHPKKHTPEKPYIIAIRLLNYLEYGPPTTKKGKVFVHLETHLMQQECKPMSYKSIYIVYDKDGEYLGKYPGWTSEEAVKKAQEVYVNRQIGKTKFCGTMEQNR